MPKISACIVAYCDYDEVCAAVRSALANTPGDDFALYVVDNASPDGCGPRLAQTDFCDVRVQVICLPKNLGFGKGHNSIMDRLTSDVHFILNPDVIIHDDILPQMAQWLLDHPGVVANGNLAWLGVRGIPIQVQPAEVVKLPFTLLLARQLAPRFGGVMQKADEHYTMQDEDLTIPRPIEFCTGSFAAIRTDVFKTIGGFDPEYFMYVEDADLTQRALRQGFVYLLPQFTATHAWHRDPMRDAGKFKMQLKSMGRYFKKWGIGKGNV